MKTTIYSVEEKFSDIPYMKLERAKQLRNLFFQHKLINCLELGFYHGKSTVFIASILNEIGEGHLTTIDIVDVKNLTPNIYQMLDTLELSKYVTPYLEEKSYNWRLMKILEQNPIPHFDFCYIDGGHSWDNTGFAFFLIDKLLRPNGWIVFDDLDYRYADQKFADGQIPSFIVNMSDEEKNTYQVNNVWELLVKHHPGYHPFLKSGNWGLAQKKEEQTVQSIKTNEISSPYPKKRSNPICHRPWTGFEIFDHLGDVRPCCWGKISCGNINTTSPEEIWNGSGFHFYREKMAKGDLNAICNSECPILLGLYSEKIPNNSQQNLLVNSKIMQENSVVATYPPLYMRVVPTTKCNLHCPMCYQLNDPPKNLPDNLFQLLDNWLHSAYEFLILGGETFVAKECIEWIRHLDPLTYPNLGLTAITNGYQISIEALELIPKRNWHWILVSIDAASQEVYKKVRGGDFGILRQGLDRLVELRMCMDSPFELRFGFTIQNSNIDDVIPFLDLCDEFNALPQYTMVFGDWHLEKPDTYEKKRKVICTLEKLDKELWSRGFSHNLISSVLTRLKMTNAPTKGWEGTIVKDIYVTDSTEGKLQFARAFKTYNKDETIFIHFGNKEIQDSFINTILQSQKSKIVIISDFDNKQPRNNINCTLFLPDDNNYIAYLEKFLQTKESIRSCTNLTIIINNKLKQYWDHIKKNLNNLEFKSFRIKLPYYLDKKSISAIEWASFVHEIIIFGESKGWEFLGGYPDPINLGLNIENQFPMEHILADTRNSNSYSLSIISPIYNRSKELPEFLASLEAQSIDEPFEIILIDDGSCDESTNHIIEFVNRNQGKFNVVIIRRNRKTPYISKTFTFTAGGARQSGANISRGKLLLFIDPDQVIDKNCLKQHLFWFRAGFEVIIGDRRLKNKIFPNEEWFHWGTLRSEALNKNSNWWLSFYTGNVSISKEVFIDVGGFDETLQYWGLDDTDLGYRLARRGVCMWHTPRAVVYHLNNDSGGGTTKIERHRAFRLHMEVLYRKYLDKRILEAHSFLFK